MSVHFRNVATEQGRSQSLDQGELIFFFFLSSLFSLLLIPLFSFFLLYTMPKFLERLVDVLMDNMG